VLKRREIEARILAPVVEALGREFGRERVLQIVRETIVGIERDQGRQLVQISAGAPDRARQPAGRRQSRRCSCWHGCFDCSGNSRIGEVGAAWHAQQAPDEMQALADDLRAAVIRSGVLAPAIRRVLDMK
jgi:hypothetical protein